jgi:heat shock protein HslJ
MSRPRALHLAVLLGTVLVVAGCGLIPGTGGVVALDGSEWRLVWIDRQAPIAGTEPTIAFDAGQLSGTTGCNSLFGGYTLSGGAFEVGELGSTMMGCDAPRSAQEQQIVERLGGATTISLVGGALVIDGPAGSLEYIAVER